MMALNSFSKTFESLGYLVKTPSIAVEEEMDCLNKALRSLGSFR